MAGSADRRERALSRARDKALAEWSAELGRLRAREDYIPELAYFLDLFEDPSIAAVEERVGMPVAAMLCLQAPVELFLAQGFFPVKIYGGSYAASNLTSPRLPALMCPTLKSILGATELDPGLMRVPWVIPLTCDWLARFKETRDLFGGFEKPVLELEVPRIKEGDGPKELWLSEVHGLSVFLKEQGGLPLKRGRLLESIKRLEGIRLAFLRLTELRRQGLIGSQFFSIVLSGLFRDLPERFQDSLETLVSALSDKAGKPDAKAPLGGVRTGGVFLTGSPVYFPNFKILNLIERAGLQVLGDDLCSSERILPRHVEVGDKSERGLLKALAETYHLGCLCPVFAANDRRAAIIKEATNLADIRGVVFHLLKGCHPYDLDSFMLEETVHSWGLRFLRIETDYSHEDSQNILTRLEAFRPTLEAKRAV
ncbi:MAG: 2-hydroxyacyl-CoA dehydratase family protein [Deltaproteobacteria bacterium]|jgi:benzoyl-CoA reductase/2-hydroxyglutaryl-CoA dehydratase subunit BcrC/BadD/HgdB|nr:2-hydroxyacyl-CoA dehydratase family protein [Deltaproteobacteria bacterium]